MQRSQCLCLTPMTSALCKSLGLTAKLISGQEALCPTRIISTLLKLRMQAVLLLQSLIHQRNNMMIERVPIFDSILKSRDITLMTKFCIVKAMIFPVVMYGCESQTIKKAEHRRIDAFEMSRLERRLLRVPWTARTSHQSVLKEINPSNQYSFIRKTDAEAEAPLLWPPVVKS